VEGLLHQVLGVIEGRGVLPRDGEGRAEISPHQCPERPGVAAERLEDQVPIGRFSRHACVSRLSRERGPWRLVASFVCRGYSRTPRSVYTPGGPGRKSAPGCDGRSGVKRTRPRISRETGINGPTPAHACLLLDGEAEERRGGRWESVAVCLPALHC
jgi:hypothetical protein